MRGGGGGSSCCGGSSCFISIPRSRMMGVRLFGYPKPYNPWAPSHKPQLFQLKALKQAYTVSLKLQSRRARVL